MKLSHGKVDDTIEKAKKMTYKYSAIDNIEPNRNDKDPEAARKVYDGNWTIYLIIALLSSCIFFAPFSFNKPLMEAKERQPFGPYMKIHLFASAIISFVCLWNVFHTPSHGEVYKHVHRWLGRIGLIASVFGAVFGFITAWFERKVDVGQGLGLTFLGALQIYWTVISYRTIREKVNLMGDVSSKEYQDNVTEIVEKHKEAVLNLWVCCLAPAWFRVPQFFGASPDSPLMFLALLFTSPFFFGVDSALRRGRFWY